LDNSRGASYPARLDMTRPAARVLTYALAIALPTLVLLAFGLSSVRRQQQAIAQLEAANLRLMTDQAARALAVRVSGAAVACLRDQAWDAIAQRPTASAVGDIRRRHPVARDLILVGEQDVVYPRLVSPLDSTTSSAHGCGAALAQAEEEEFAGQVRSALVTYRRCLADGTIEPQDRARVLARVARAERRLGNDAAAIEAYEALASRHADAPDRFARPFGLVAALELHDLRPRASAPLLRRARTELVAGRWDVSDEQARYFLEEFETRLGDKLPADAPAPFLRTLDVARAIQQALPLAAALDDAVHEDEVLTEGRRTRIHHAGVGGGRVMQAVLVPDVRWIEHDALPAVATELGLPAGTRILADQAGAPGEGIVASADGALAPWRLWVPTAEARGRGRWAPVALQGAITLLVSGVLAFGVMLVVRDVRRDQSIAQMRSQFVSAASHELRTPLAMILLYAQTLLEDVDADREERRGSYEIIAEESERLRHLLDKVLDFARIDAGRRSYRFVTADLDASVNAAVRLFEPHLLRRGFTLESEIEAIPDVHHDPEAITGAVLNLLENAAKYSDASRVIHLRLATRRDEIVIDVRDHGIGIPPEDLPQIGQQFFRSRLSTSIGGYGLGLYLVRHAMTAHGGRMEVASTPGEGSTFTLVLPGASQGSKEIPA
jgi:signal transduction histidine kinase